jgi:uncharacterized protein (DUF305 family)
MVGMGILPFGRRPPPGAARRRAIRHRAAAVLVAVVLVAAGYLLGASRSTPEVPRDGTVDVGFLRDMMVHHAQAVTLAMIVDQRATVPAVREMADEIATGQQREVGMMAGWLQQWGLSDSTSASPMAWMAHPPAAAAVDPPMPGMATRRDVARLAVTRGRQADLLFCRLMLPHHLGALHMIDDVVARGSRPEVIALAAQMRTGQQKEINLLNRLLTELNTA